MNFLKGFGGGNSMASSKVSAGSAQNVPAKNNYFSSLNLKYQLLLWISSAVEKPKGSPDRKKGPPKDFVPEKYALSFDPPCIIMEYSNPQTKKLYHHRMRIRKLKKDTNPRDALDYLKKKHYHYFASKVIDEAQIEKLVEKLKLGLPGDEKEQMREVSEVSDDFQFDYQDDFDDL